jgi:salicylate hydroxylase
MKIAVIGSGICGLGFAAAMRRNHPDVEVHLYERDRAADVRFQGYSLGMKMSGGIPVLRELGLFDSMRAEMLPVSNFVFCDQKGTPLLELPSGSDDKNLNLRVKRSVLKDALRGAAPDVPIEYGMVCTGYTQDDSGVDLTFSNGQSVHADYAVAADGVSSAPRQQLVGDSKRYLGLTCIVGQAPIEMDHPLLAGGYFLMLGDNGRSVFCYRDLAGFHFSYTEHAESEATLSTLAPDALLRRIREATASWSAPVPRIAAALDPASLVVRGYYDKEPLDHVRDGRLWLLGDAAHPMSPFQGQGANMAMLDALKLAELLGGATVSPSAAAALETDIVTRGRKAVLESRSSAMQFHTTSRFKQMNRNAAFRVANVFIKLFNRGPRTPRPSTA